MAISKTLQQIIDLVADVAPAYDFVYANANMMNVQADSAQFSLCYCEEITSQRYNKNAVGRMFKHTAIELYFMRRAPMQGEAIGRDEIREQIEQEAVLPFLRRLWDRQPFTQAITGETPPPMFDDNDVAVAIRFEWEEVIC